MTHGHRWQYLKDNDKLCECIGYYQYKEYNIYFCINCNKPVPEPIETIRGNVRTIGIEHSRATGIPMKYYNKYYDGNSDKVWKEYLANK